MAFSASFMVITLRYLLLGQQCQTGQVYDWDGVVIAAATAEQVGEAWWNHVKTDWRALAPNVLDLARFTSVHVREIGGNLSQGEYAIPSDEQEGTRDAGSSDSMLPSYTAVGCRLTVGSGVTRPGQKRFPFLIEGDVASNVVSPAFLALCEPVAEFYSSPIIFGAPLATGVVAPYIVTYGADQNTVAASQEVQGFILNQFVTSQVSRRYGHGN